MNILFSDRPHEFIEGKMVHLKKIKLWTNCVRFKTSEKALSAS